MKTINQIMLFSFTALLILIGAAFKPVQSRSDFSGNWALNKERSELAGLPAEKATALGIKILQKADSLRIERAFDGRPISIESFGFKGKPVEQVYPGATVSRIMARSDDGKVMTILSKYKMNPENEEPWEYTRTETYALADEGKTLVLERITVTPDGTEKVKALYNRK